MFTTPVAITSLVVWLNKKLACAHRELHDQSGGRFLLGLGVSHSTMVEGLLQRDYPKPVPSMRAYLEAMKNAMWWGPELDGEPPIVLAALGPLMLKVAAELTLGAHPFFAPPENTSMKALFESLDPSPSWP